MLYLGRWARSRLLAPRRKPQCTQLRAKGSHRRLASWKKLFLQRGHLVEKYQLAIKIGITIGNT